MVLYDQRTATTYRNAGFGARAHRGRHPAVIVVDLTRGFTDLGFPTGADLSDTIEATNTLTRAARSRAIPVLFTSISYSEAEARGNAIAWLAKAQGLRALVDGTPAVELDPRLSREPREPLIVKKGASAFFGTDVLPTLVDGAIDTVLVCGATTSGCVRATVVDAVQNGFHVLVPRQCVGDRASGPHDASLYDIDEKYGDVISLDDALAYLGGCTNDAKVGA
jgi:maleamate amidohydrolase